MNYTVNKSIEIFNTSWKQGDTITDEDIDKIFSQDTKEYLLLDKWIEEIKPKEMKVKRGYSKRHHRWDKGVYVFADKKMDSEEEYEQTESILISNPTPEMIKAIENVNKPKQQLNRFYQRFNFLEVE